NEVVAFGAEKVVYVHDLFRTERNHFVALERAAEELFGGRQIPAMEVYSVLKTHLEVRHGVQVAGFETSDDTKSLREFDEENGVLRLADALDYPNRAFQLAHIIGLFGQREIIDRIVRDAELSGDRVVARYRVELANYFAAAVLMPYDAVLSAARDARYDIDRIAAQFGVSYEQACHRLTTLQRDGAHGIPFFFLRIDKAGNVTKRFNATRFHLAEYGGACPRWDIHFSFRTPGRILPQFVEMPDGERYFTINRTVDRPASGYRNQDHRLAVTLGCPAEFAVETVYADGFQLDDPSIYTPIGINCRLCPRQRCSQRAHQPLHMDLPIDETRRGITRFES
ncbi:MAG: short-chain fatty acyl-CoA regulator family protein, partial [Pseudomonadota bacterium]